MTINIVDRLRNLLGRDVVLLPIPGGEKGPRFKGWQDTTLEQMNDPEYLARLNHGGNIGVLLGKPSGGLCSIDVDSDEDLAAFLALNPALAGTLRTRRVRGGNVWVRIQGGHPSLAKLAFADSRDWGEWRADGGQTVIHGQAIDRKKGETAPTVYTMVVEAPPAQIAFADIVWPDGLVLPWQARPPAPDDAAPADDLVLKCGEPYYRNNNGTLSLNESYWAGLYAAEHVLLYEPDEKCFYQYNAVTGLYEELSADAIKQEISDRMLDASRAAQIPELERKRTATTLNNIVAHLRGMVEKRHAFSDRPTPFIHLANGILVFREDQEADLVPFSPEFYSRNQSPIAFDETARCDRFLNELLLPAVTAEDAVLIQQFTGLCLLGRNLIQRLLILDGEGGRGKTQLAIVIQSLVGTINVSQLRTEHLSKRFELYRFLKKTLLVGVDVPANFLNSNGATTLKGLVGGDLMDAEQKGGNGNFPVEGNFCVLITSNSRLCVRLEGDLSAWRRRLLIVRYEAPPPPRKIPDFGKLLINTEGPGILNWALVGLRQLLVDVAASGDIRMTRPQQDTVDNLLAESDSLRHFLMDCLIGDASSSLTVSELVEAYAQYCPARGWRAMPITQIHAQLETLMLELFGTGKSNSIERDGKKSHRGFRRVRFKADQYVPQKPLPEELF